MQSIQITNFSPEEFTRLLQQTAESAARQAVEAFSKAKENPNEEITVTQIAQLWDCSKQTVSRRIRDHKVPTSKLGRDIAIKRKFLETIKNPLPKES